MLRSNVGIRKIWVKAIGIFTETPNKSLGFHLTMTLLTRCSQRKYGPVDFAASSELICDTRLSAADT